MKRKWLNTSLIMAGAWFGSICCAYAQQNDNGQFYDPDRHKLIPDKVFEIGLPLLFIFLLANAVVTVIKIRAENRLREKVLDKQISEEAMLTLFAKQEPHNKYLYLKWFLILAAIGLSFILMRMLAFAPGMDQGYMSMGIIALNLSLAFLIYYIIINKKEA